MFSVIAKCFSSLTKKETRDVKLLMLGLDNAGKSTIINDLRGEPKETTVPTVGFAMADIRMLNFKVKAYDVGGGPQIRAIWRDYYAEIFGVVYVVDASDQERVAESRTVLREALSDSRLAGKPVVLFANKQDKEGALSEMDIEHQFEIEQLSAKSKSPFKVFQCTAFLNDGRKIDSQLKKGLTWLLQTMKQDFTLLSERVQKECLIQKENEKKERAKRLERIRKAQEERQREAKEAETNATVENTHSDDDDEDDDDVVFGNVLPKVKHVSKTKKKKRKSTNEEDLQKNEDKASDIVETPKTKDVHLKENDKEITGISEQCNGEVRKKRKKKRRTKRNRTAPAPMNDEDDSDTGVVLRPLAWKTPPPSGLNGLQGKGRMLEPIRPPLHNSLYSPSRTSTITEEEDDGKLTDFSYTSRPRPNAEDYEVVT